jgi:hypothetical protein
MRILPSIAVLLGCCGSAAVELLADEQGVSGRAQARRALAEVDRWLGGSQHAEAWHDYLDTHALRRELARKGPADLAVVEGWLQGLTADTRHAAHPPLVTLRRSVEGWLARESLPEGRYLPAVVASILRSPGGSRGESSRLGTGSTATSLERPSRGELRRQLVALAAMLSQYAERPDDGLAQSIDDELRRLDGAREASSLVDAVRDYYGHPNVWIDVSQELLDDRIARRIERTEPVSDVILGAAVSGSGHLRATSSLLIEASSERAVLKIAVRGQVDARTTGRKGPARIHSHSTTTFHAEKRLVIEETGLRTLPTVCKAETSAVSSDVSTAARGLLGRVVGGVVQRRWQASREAARQEAARHIEKQVADAVDREADEFVGRFERFVIAPIVGLANGGSTEARIRFCSQQGVLRIGVRRGPLGAPPGIPPVDPERLLTVRLHSSLVNRMGSFALSEAVAPGYLKELSLFMPLRAFEGLVSPPARLLPSFSRTSSWPPPIFGERPWRGLALKWLGQTVGPRFDFGGIVLRDGRWGRLTPGELGGEWPLLGWHPVAVSPAEVGLPPAAGLPSRLEGLR